MRWVWPILPTLAALVCGCAPEIGDSCESSVDCDIQNKRICDLTLPGGYCTVSGCEKGTCPDEAVCVNFRPQPERLSNSWCMASCDDDGDCRGGYRCRRAEQLGMIAVSSYGQETGEVAIELQPLASSLDGDSARFCTVDLPAPAIGDECKSGLDCDLEQQRECDLTLPGGYCTVTGCEQGSCPDDAVCVALEPEEGAETVNRCLASCEEDWDCRSGYGCRTAEQLGEKAQSLDGDSEKFCTVDSGG
jgi:hypothetical protein